ncbi:MAG TPA: carboxylesterase/lipase family protein [Candidatus Acidoferrum sp.]|nr:carboxylesterase/lipase family protein [Candidatus Acidoferrum sp.]
MKKKQSFQGREEPPQIASSSARPSIGRRDLLKGAALAVGVSGAATFGAANATKTATPSLSPPGISNVRIVASNENAIVETTAGKVRGFTRNGIVTFLGIPYAGSTAGTGRFQPPTKPTPWAGLRSSMQYGFVSPQEPRAGWANDEVAWMFDWDDGRPGEDCLRVNIWTPGVNDNKKRPVMVWLHGGGFSAGSGQELKSYYGENLSRRGDVVVASLNHRLGVLGYLDLAEVGGAKYADSANLGMLDIVAALEWVRDNIANFGGDPGNVLIFGQSGGGGKVNTLMAMPAAKGLFHRAAVQSGSLLNASSPEDSAKLGAAVVQQLGLSGSQIDKIQEVPVEQLVQAGISAVRSLSPPFQPGGTFRLPRIGWQPTVDAKNLPSQPFDPVAPAMSAHVPLLVGTVLNEFSSAMFDPKLASLAEDDLKQRVSAQYKDKSDHIIGVFRAAHPKATPGELMSRISASPVRQSAVTQAERQAALGGAPVYSYWFCWRTPVLDGRPGAFHCSELAFVFDNTDRCAPMTGGGPGPRAIAAKVSQAWISFARRGDPNHPGLPKWPAFTASDKAVMIFDNICEAKNDPDRDERKALGLA